MKIVYLDQNKWIELSRELYNRDPAHRLKHVLRATRAIARRGLACFPLSLGHYIETNRALDPRRRWRLADFMLELSEGRTLAPVRAITARETDDALASLFPGRVTVRPFKLLGRGLEHASPVPLQRVVPHGVPGLQRLAAYEDRVMLSGAMPGGTEGAWEEAPRHELRKAERAFHQHLERWAQQTPDLDGDLLERLLYANEVNDILAPLNRALEHHRIEPNELVALGLKGGKAFVDSMPAARVQMHLHRQLTKNPTLRIKPNDLNDWGHVGVAVAYCDVVVTEKLLANLLSRDRFASKAVVISDLRELPGLLVR